MRAPNITEALSKFSLLSYMKIQVVSDKHEYLYREYNDII